MSLLCFLLTTVNKLNPEGVCLETPSLPKHISKMGNLRLTNKQTKLNCVIWIWSLTRDLFCKCDSYGLQIQIGADECLSSNNLLSRVLSLSTWWQGWKFEKQGRKTLLMIVTLVMKIPEKIHRRLQVSEACLAKQRMDCFHLVFKRRTKTEVADRGQQRLQTGVLWATFTSQRIFCVANVVFIKSLTWS